jgi:hypothetical protein
MVKGTEDLLATLTMSSTTGFLPRSGQVTVVVTILAFETVVGAVTRAWIRTPFKGKIITLGM